MYIISTNALSPISPKFRVKEADNVAFALFTLDPKIGHFGVLCSQTKKVYGGMEIRYHEYHPWLPLTARSITPTTFTKDTSTTWNAGPSPQVQTESRKSTCIRKVRNASRKPQFDVLFCVQMHRTLRSRKWISNVKAWISTLTSSFQFKYLGIK